MVRRERPTLPTVHHGFRPDEYTDKPMSACQFLLASGSGTNSTTTALASTTPRPTLIASRTQDTAAARR